MDRMKQKARAMAKFGKLISLSVLVPMFIFTAGSGAHAALLFSENFQGHADGSTAQSANGWAGDTVNVNNSANFGGSRVLDGTDIGGTVDGFAYTARNLGGNLAGGSVHRMSMQVFAQTSSLPSHNNGMGFSSSGGANDFENSAHWAVLYDLNNVAGRTGYLFDARNLTGGASDYLLFEGPFNAVQTLDIVLDGAAGEVYGVYDFGAGAVETTHYAVSAARIAAIDQVFGYFDFRSAHPGGTFASTGRGTQFGAAQWDNISVTGTFDAVPEPGMAGLLALAVGGIGFARRRGVSHATG
jgi:hypothetical protein